MKTCLKVQVGWFRFKRRLHYLVMGSDMNALRLMLALGTIATGLQFAIWPVDVFPTAAQIANGGGRHTYVLMAQIAPEWAWGWAFTAQGVLMLHSLFFGVFNKLRLWMDAALGALLWNTAVLCCYFAYWPGDGNIALWRIPKIMGMEWIAALTTLVVLYRYSIPEKNKNGR
jgi:hypothetical protein